MSYQVLARKWRPKTFESLVGQEHVVRALTHALTEKRLHHAYLFTGTRGVGKTTLARILAKALNCETGITATPCGVCSACTEIDSGRFVDLLEIDAATNTGIDEMRQLLENAVYAPTRGRFKVYVIDEVHMLSKPAFNSMLKTLEEPPDHVKFILATTDPQKIPVTVLSRCLQFNLKQMPPSLIVGHLREILSAEAISADPGALNLLSRSANGSMRDALSLLDQAIAHGGGKVEETQVREMLGTVDLDYLFTILESLLDNNPAQLLSAADDMATRSLSFDLALQGLATLFTQIQVAQLAPQAIPGDAPDRAQILDMAARLDPEFVQLAYQITVHGRKELALAPDEQDGFVMTLLRLYAFRPAAPEEGTARIPSEAVPKRTSPATESSKLAELPKAPPAPASSRNLRVARTEKTGVPPQQVLSEPLPDSPPPKKNIAEPVVDEWHGIVASLELSGMARELGQHCGLRGIEGDRVVLCLPPAHKHLQMKAAQEKLQQALSSHFGHPVRLVINLEDAAGDTPADRARRLQNEQQEQAVEAFEQNDFVREIVDFFDATVIKSSIKPV